MANVNDELRIKQNMAARRRADSGKTTTATEIAKRAEQERLRRLQEKEAKRTKIKREIEEAKKELEKIQDKKTQYDNMKTKIEQVIEKLKFANVYILSSKEQLNKSYKSENGSNEYKKYYKEINIETLIGELNNCLVKAINKINSIEKDLSYKEAIIRELHNELNYI